MAKKSNPTTSKLTKPTLDLPKFGLSQRLNNLVVRPNFARLYGLFGLLVLLGTSIFWALAGARLQNGNADQLVNSFLFKNAATFHAATIPGQHTFLLKWPLFLIVRAFNYSSASFIAVTVGAALITVAVLAFIMYRVERRLLVFGTLCLALSSVLLLVPAQPYAGALLPVNMAMLATRNLEYVLYIASLVVLIRSFQLKNFGFWLATALLATLIASDKLFLTISVGGAILALLTYAFANGWNMVRISVHWLIEGLLASVAALAILGYINAHHITQIAGSGSNGPYGFIHSGHELVLGVSYGLLALLTNFGANPAYGATILKNVPHAVVHGLLSYGGPAYIINALILVAGLIAAIKILLLSLAHNKSKDRLLDNPAKLSLVLLWSALAAGGSFVVTRHDYSVDARYLTISVFTIFITLATFTRKLNIKPLLIVLCGVLISLGTIGGLVTASRINTASVNAGADINNRNNLIAQALARHKVDVLVGDYWRVIPAKLTSNNTLNVMPLSGCLQARDILSSKTWQPNLKTSKVAYLLTLDKGLTDFPTCTLSQIVADYGRPNSSIVISGSLLKPKELLLFYDDGIRHNSPTAATTSRISATVTPTTIDELPNTYCSTPTDMNIVAHQDDDLLFMNPDIQNSINAGHCERTIYLTAGDAGANAYYYLSREQGSEAAYTSMTGSNSVWVNRILQISDHQFVTIANPRNNSKISLIFMHLPDGNVNGSGFKSSGNESLEKLESGAVHQMHSVDKQSYYSSADIEAALTLLMKLYQPALVRTQANFASKQYPDHSDHMAVGRFVKRAYTQYLPQQFVGGVAIPLKFYIGYPIHAMAENVSGKELTDKQTVFFKYGLFDGGVCQTLQLCNTNSVYGTYLKRQYQNAN